MCNVSTPLPLARLLAALLLALWLSAPAHASIPLAPGRSLAEALNPDGTLKLGANGSFDAHQFRMSTAPDGRPVFGPAGTTGAGDERWADGFGLPEGVLNEVYAVVQAGNDIYIGGRFTAVGNIGANRVAKWNGTAWSSLGTGAANGITDGEVYTLAVAANGDVYAGGLFTQAGGVTVRNIAKWNGTSWSGANTGLNGIVYALAVAPNGNVYAGGLFRPNINGAEPSYVARWDGSAWSSLGTGAANGVNNIVKALVVGANGDVYVGGSFSEAGGTPASYIAKWNGTAWSSLGTGGARGTNATVAALALAANGDLYVGGGFTQVDGIAVSSIAKWNGTSWSSLGTGAGGVNGAVSALAVAPNGDVYVGGSFTQAGGGAVGNIAKWNGSTWSSLGTGIGGASPYAIRALAVTTNGNVHVSGAFAQAGGVRATGLAKWNGSAWSSLSMGPADGVLGLVYTLAVAPNGDVYVGGRFSYVGGVAANNVAKWNGTTWSSLGVGTANGIDAYFIAALAVAANGDVYAGGVFTQAGGGVVANNIAKWNGTTWSNLGMGLTGSFNGVSNGYVYALAVAGNGDVYVGGRFTQAGGIATNGIAKWNGTNWGGMGTGTGTNDYVYALAVAPNGNVYAGGSFTQISGVAANNIARWNGSTWSSLGTGTINGLPLFAMRAVAVTANGDVYVGGASVRAGQFATTYIAKWNGSVWSSLGASVNAGDGYIYALAIATNGDVYAGGIVSQLSGIVANNIAKWNGSTWSTLGTGVNSTMSGLGIGPTGKLYAGGDFTATGDGSKAMSCFGIYDPAAPLATAAATAAPAAQLFSNPAHNSATLRLPTGAPRQPVILVDALGRTVRRYPAPTVADIELDLRGLPAGSYVVRCGEISQRLVVE